MTPEDKEFARTCLEKKWLTIEQVEEIKRVVAERKMSFRQVAIAYGVVREKPAGPGPPVYVYLMVGTLALVVVGASVTAAVAYAITRRSALEAARQRSEIDRREREANAALTGESNAKIDAERKLRHAHESLRYVEVNDRKLSERERVARLEEAVAGFDRYLELHGDDPNALLGRARARDMLGRLPDALADYEKAARLEPALARQIEPQAARLREALGRPK